MANLLFTWVKNYLGNKFYPYTHADAVYVDDILPKNLTTALDEMNRKINTMQENEVSDLHYHDNMEILNLITNETINKIETSYGHISDKTKHIPSDGVNGQIIGKKNDTIEWINPQIIPTKLSQLENDTDFITNMYLESKVDKIDGKGLSENDYTTDDKDKVTKLNFSKLVSECEISGHTITFKDIDGSIIKTFDIPQPTFSIVDGELFVSY